jgi:hypothetical protein
MARFRRATHCRFEDNVQWTLSWMVSLKRTMTGGGGGVLVVMELPKDLDILKNKITRF